MIARTCPVCGTAFALWPNRVRPVNWCSVACRAVAASEEAGPLGDFDPGPPVGPHDAWVDAWRAERARQETPRRRLVAVDGDVWGWS